MFNKYIFFKKDFTIENLIFDDNWKEEAHKVITVIIQQPPLSCNLDCWIEVKDLKNRKIKLKTFERAE